MYFLPTHFSLPPTFAHVLSTPRDTHQPNRSTCQCVYQPPGAETLAHFLKKAIEFGRGYVTSKRVLLYRLGAFFK
jgi:hypothetical protein